MSNQERTTPTGGSTSRLEAWFAAPFSRLDSIPERRQAQLTAILSLVTFLINVFGIAIIFLTSQPNLLLVELLIGLNLLFLVAYLLGRTRFYRVGALLLTGGLSASGYVIAFSLAAPNTASISGAITSTIPIALVLGGALLGIWGNLAMTLINFVLIFLLPGLLPSYTNSSAGQDAGTIFTIGMLAMVLAAYRNRTERMNLQASQGAAEELQAANRELQENRDTLEDRTRELQSANALNSRHAVQLAAISKISETISVVHDLPTLLPLITQAIADEFDYDHAGIYLLDESRENAVLRAASSEGGQKMASEGHQVKVASQGLIGYVSAYGVPHIASDTDPETAIFSHPDLPDIHSALAIPLIIDQQVFGVLDIQSHEVSAFNQEDLKVLSSLGNQVSIVIQNARQFEETSRSLHEARSAYGQLFQAALRQAEVEKRYGFRLSGTNLTRLETPLETPEFHRAVEHGEKILRAGAAPGDPAVMTVPIKLRDEVIGVLDVRIPQPRNWSEEEIDVVEALADRVAIAVENAALLEETQRRAAKERVIGEITSKISSSINMSNVLQTAVEELGRAIPGSDVIIQFQGNPESGR